MLPNYCRWRNVSRNLFLTILRKTHLAFDQQRWGLCPWKTNQVFYVTAKQLILLLTFALSFCSPGADISWLKTMIKDCDQLWGSAGSGGCVWFFRLLLMPFLLKYLKKKAISCFSKLQSSNSINTNQELIAEKTFWHWLRRFGKYFVSKTHIFSSTVQPTNVFYLKWMKWERSRLSNIIGFVAKNHC